MEPPAHLTQQPHSVPRAAASLLYTLCHRAGRLNIYLIACFASLLACFVVPAGSPSLGGDVTVYVYGINQQSLPTPFNSVLVSVFCLYGPFNCISFHEFSRQLSVFSLFYSGLIYDLLVLSTICLFMKVSFSPDIIPSG